MLEAARLVLVHEHAFVFARAGLSRARLARTLLNALALYHQRQQNVGHTCNAEEADLYIAVIEWLVDVEEMERWS